MIRKDILSDPVIAEQYFRGVTLLKDPIRHPWPGNAGLSVYDFFVAWHHASMMLMTPANQSDRNAAHSGPVFLPWHRYLLLRLEDRLRAALNDNTFRLPYWDWTADAELPDPRTSAIWNANAAGQFLQGSWRVRLIQNPMQQNRLTRVNRRLTRRLAGSPGAALPSLTQVRTVILNQTDYDRPPYNSTSSGFRNYAEGWIGPARIHNSVHVWVGGDMLLATSPNDPIFFLHHCNVDRIWAAWQRRYPNASYVPDQSAPATLAMHRIDDPLHTFFNENPRMTPRRMLAYEQYYRYDTLTDFLGTNELFKVPVAA